MGICFCRFLLAAAVLVIALVAWGASWAKIAVIIGAALLAIASLGYKTCCCRMRQEGAAEITHPPSSPSTD
jgi:hypothetical protein